MITGMSENYGSGGKRLLRPKDGRLVAGVCTGLAAYFGIDVKLVRLGFGVFTVFYGLGLIIYAVAWAVLPDEGGGTSILESLLRRR
jgi:phage shock protein PspC (stress-responsive transcriptional regulator)